MPIPTLKLKLDDGAGADVVAVDMVPPLGFGALFLVGTFAQYKFGRTRRAGYRKQPAIVMR